MTPITPPLCDQSNTAVSRLQEASEILREVEQAAAAARRERNRLIVEAAKSLTERQVAEVAGVSGVYVHKLKHGERRV